MKQLLTICLFCLSLLATNILAQKATKPLKFSSAYTNLNKDCKTIKGGEGTDDASDCRGIGGYRIRVWFSATTQHIGAETPKTKDMVNLATQGLDFDQNKVKVEWRMANGKPFVVIMRVFKYGETDENNPYVGKKIGEELIIKGLKGFEKIDFKVDTKTRSANAKARKLADNAYLNK